MTKRKVIKMYKKRKAPDIRNKIPDLKYSTISDKALTKLNYKRVTACVVLVVVLIVTFLIAVFYNENYGTNESNNTIIVDNSTSKTEGNESKENETTYQGMDHVIQNNSIEDEDSKSDVIQNNSNKDDDSKDDVIYNDTSPDDNTSIDKLPSDHVLYGPNGSCGNIEEVIAVGMFQIYDSELRKALETPQYDDCLYAVNLMVGFLNRYELSPEIYTPHPAIKDPRFGESIDKYYKLIRFNEELWYFTSSAEMYLNGDVTNGINDINSLMNQANVVKSYITQIEEMGGFNTKFYKQEIVGIIYKLYDSTEEELKNASYLKSISEELKKICYITDEVILVIDGHPSVLMLDLLAYEEWYYEMQWVCDIIVKDFEKNCGVSIRPIECHDAMARGFEPYECFEAILTKEQIYSLKNDSYGVFIAFQGKSNGFVE